VGLSGSAAARGPARFKLAILCRGKAARVQEGIADTFAGKSSKPIDGKLAVAYYAARLAAQAQMKITAVKDGEDAVLTLEPR